MSNSRFPVETLVVSSVNCLEVWRRRERYFFWHVMYILFTSVTDSRYMTKWIICILRYIEAAGSSKEDIAYCMS